MEQLWGPVTSDDPPAIVRVVAHPLRWSVTPPTYRLPPPALGEHTAQILAELSDEAGASAHATSDTGAS